MRGRKERGGWGWLIATAPAVFALVVVGAAWIAVSVTGSEEPTRFGAYGFAIGVVAAVVAPIALVVTRRREAVTWAVISLGVSIFGLLFAFLLLAEAALHNCNGTCLS